MKQNKYQIKCKKCEKNNFNVFSCLNKNIEKKSKGKSKKKTNISQNGPGGVCVKRWCKKENKTQAQPKSIFFNLQPVCSKNARFSC